MAKCQNCGRGAKMGRTSKHKRGVASHKFAKRAPKKAKLFRANIQKTTFKIGGMKVTMKLCSRCLKRMRKDALEERQREAKKSEIKPVKKEVAKETKPAKEKKRRGRPKKTGKK